MIKAYINQLAYELDADYSISEQVANKIASDITIVLKNGQPIPKCGEIIEIKDVETDTIYFLGVCGIPKSPKFSSPYDVKRYSITCGNANCILARRVVNVAYKSYTITQIVQALFEKYVQYEGFTLGKISDIPIKFNIYTASDYSLQYCLDELAEYVGGTWHCTNDKLFYFVARDDFEAFPHIIDDKFIPITDLEVKVKDTDLRTSQIISGGKAETKEQHEEFCYDGETKNFKVSFEISKKPKIVINNKDIPSERIGLKGSDDLNNNIMFLYSSDSATIIYNSQYIGENPSPLIVGDIIQIQYVGLFPIRAIIQNNESISEISKNTGTSGIIDNVKMDKNVRDINDAIQLGNTLLENYGVTRTELSCWISIKHVQAMGLSLNDFQLLKRWTFNLPNYGAVGEFVLTERTLTPFIKNGDSENLKISLTLVDCSFLKSYGQVFSELSKAISQLSIREEDIVVDVDATNEKIIFCEVFNQLNEEVETVKEEIFASIEKQSILDYTDFMILYCTSEQQFLLDGQLTSPTGLSSYAFSEAIGG